jgi:peroxiredoxin
MDLSTRMQSFREDWERRVGEPIAARIRDDIDTLRASGIQGGVLRRGDRLPAATGLLDAHGAPFDLAAHVGRHALVLVVYRGGWCPYCSFDLRAYQERLGDIEAMGAVLVAVSPERPELGLDTQHRNGLGFAVVSDPGNRFVDALGLRFTLAPGLRALYAGAGHALPDVNGDGSWTLPIPGTFVVDACGTVALADADPDYRWRLDPQRAVDALAALAAGCIDPLAA